MIVAPQTSEDDVFPWKDPEFCRAPWPWYQRALRDHPVYRLENGTYCVSRYEDVVTYAKLPSLTIAPPGGMGDSPWGRLSNTVLLNDPPLHTEKRRRFSRWLTPKMVRTWMETTAAKVEQALDEIGEDGVIDSYRDLCVQPAHAAMCAALGIPEDDAIPVIHEMNRMILSLKEDPTRADMEGSSAGLDYLLGRSEEIIEWKRANRGAGSLLDELLGMQERGECTYEEVHESIVMLWGSAGHNPGYLLSAGFETFARQPEVWEAYRREPEQRDAIINELVRMNPPEVTFERFPTEPLEIGGVHIEPGERIKFMIAAANRDPLVFEHPDEFDHRRSKEASVNLSFGLGPHSCAGQVISRAEARTTFDIVADRFGHVEVIGEPVWVFTDRSRGCEGMTIRLSA